LKKLPAGVTVFMDEAYHHFVDSPDYTSFLDKPMDDERMLVARTFSKVYGLAGSRLGYSVAPKKLTDTMLRYQLLDNCNQMVLHPALRGVDDAAPPGAAIARTDQPRADFWGQVKGRNVSVLPSQAIFFRGKPGRPVREMIPH